MKRFSRWALLALLFPIVLRSPRAAAQAAPTAVQRMQLSAFGGFTGTYTDLLGGRNLGITAGADLDLFDLHHFHPSIELRGTFPVDSGQIDGQKDFLGGIRVDRTFGNFRPYADFLIGRGQINYQHGGFEVGPLLYISTNTTVYSPGVGLDYDLSHHWSAKADLQYQTWHTPVVPGQTIHPKAITVGLVYHFDFNRSYRHRPDKHANDQTRPDRRMPPQPVQQSAPPPEQQSPTLPPQQATPAPEQQNQPAPEQQNQPAPEQQAPPPPVQQGTPPPTPQ